MAKALKELFQKIARDSAAEWTEIQPAWLGNFAGDVTTADSGVLYARLINGKVVRVHNTFSVPPTFDLHVAIGRNRNLPSIWQIVRIIEDFDAPASAGQIGYHESQHRFGSGDMLPVNRKQIMALTAIVSDPAGFIVTVYGSLVRTATGIVLIDTQNVDLSGEVVTAGAVFVNIEADDDGVLSLNTGTVFGAPVIATSANIPVPAVGKYMIATVIIYEGQAELSDDDIRVPFPLETGAAFAPTAKGVTNGDSHDHVGGDGAPIAYSSLSGTPTIREVLTAARTYYVRTDGSDSNTGLANTAGGAFLTIQKAYDVTATLDLGGYTVTIQIADGTYTGGLVITKPWIGGDITIQGNAGTPANVVISTSGDSISNASASLPAALTVKDMKLTSSAGNCLSNYGTGLVQFQNINFGAAASFQVYSFGAGAMISCLGNYAISAGALGHCGADGAGAINIAGVTVTITGTPAFSYTFAGASQGPGLIRIHANTFSGSATGSRYNVATNAVIFTNGGGATYLPGDAAGSTATGGQYV